MASVDVDDVPTPSEEVKSKLSGSGPPQPALLEVSPQGNGREEDREASLARGDGALESGDRKGPPNNGAVPSLDASAVMEGREGELDTSTTVLLRQGQRNQNGPNLFRFSTSTIDATRTDFTLTDTFRVSGKTCTVTLEEDCIHWIPTKKPGEGGRGEGRGREGGRKPHSSSCMLISKSHIPCRQTSGPTIAQAVWCTVVQ